MAGSKFTILRVVADVVSFIVVVAATVGLYVSNIAPVQRGFFCDDQTIQYPYRGDTVSSTLDAVLGFIVPCIPIVILEILRVWFAMSRKEDCSTSFDRRQFLQKCFVKLCLQGGVFVFGATVCMLITEFLKLTVGRLRPHFIDLCRPDPTSYNCSDGYIINFRCSSDASESALLDARKSFPSGHSSFTIFSVTYLVMYLQIRLPRRETRLFRPLLQTVSIIGALYVLVSRVSDHKHHWSDVLAGSILGFAVAFLTVLFISDLWTPSDPEVAEEATVLPMTLRTSSSPTAAQYNVGSVNSGHANSKGD